VTFDNFESDLGKFITILRTYYIENYADPRCIWMSQIHNIRMLFVGDEPARPIVDGDPRVYLCTVYRPVKSRFSSRDSLYLGNNKRDQLPCASEALNF